MKPLRLFLQFLALLPLMAGAAWPATSAPHVQYFGYWDAAGQNPFPLQETIDDQKTHSNITMNVYLVFNAATQQFEDPYGAIAKAEAAGLKMIINSGAHMGGSPDYKLHWLGENPVAFNSWVNLVRPHIQNIAAIFVADEADCGAPFPNGWTPTNCNRTRTQLEAMIAQIKTAFPNTPTWINYTSAWINGAGFPNAASLGYKVPVNVDWVSMDCYTPFEACYGSKSVSHLLNNLKPKLSPNQRLALIPQGFQGSALTETQVAAVAEQYYQYAQTEPKIIGIFPFIWWNLYPPTPHWIGVRDSPIIRAKYTDIGTRIVGTKSWPPTGFHDASDCTQSIGWACDADNYGAPLDIHFYADGPAGSGVFVGAVTANTPREPGVGAACGGNANHGFVFPTPASLKDGNAHTIHAHAINIGPAGNNPLLSGTPKSFTCTTQPVNQPPTVNAGLDQIITLPASANLTGTASDEGLPNPPGAVSTTWSKLSGPGTVSFGNVSSRSTTALFSQAGTYILRLTASDSVLSATDDLTITVNPPPPVNQPPTVSAGSDQTITLPSPANLLGSASDDGLPNPPGAVTTTWSKLTGPGTVSFGNVSSRSTTALFSAAGTYTLRLTASDSALSATDDVTVTVNTGSAQNQAPVVNAGSDLRITLPAGASLAGAAVDDRLPNPPSQLTTTWSKLSGPGAVGFGDAGKLITTATFSAQGIYVLRLAASDGALSASDTLTVNVSAVSGGVLPEPDLSGINGRTFTRYDTITLSYSGNASGFGWEFIPAPSGQASAGVLAYAAQAPVVTATPRFNLSSLSLPPGRYEVRVQALAAGQQSNWATASITLANDVLAGFRAYPNPVSAARGDVQVIFDRMPANSSVKIFTVSGRHVKSLNAPTGAVVWDLTNDSGDKVASGIYLYLISDSQNRKAQGKLTVIR